MKKQILAGLMVAAISAPALAVTIEGTGSSFQYPEIGRAHV